MNFFRPKGAPYMDQTGSHAIRWSPGKEMEVHFFHILQKDRDRLNYPLSAG